MEHIEELKKEFREIPITENGGVVALCLVDFADFKWLCKYKWNVARNTVGTIYARGYYKGSSKRMHRVITNAPKNLLVDHINGNTLDNRRNNLRLVTSTQNAMNRKPNGKIKYKGVSYNGGKTHTNKPYSVSFTKDSIKTHIGHYTTQEEAARAYDEQALKHFKEFAYLNFPLSAKSPKI